MQILYETDSVYTDNYKFTCIYVCASAHNQPYIFAEVGQFF